MRPSQDSDASYYYGPLAAAAQGFVVVHLLRFEVVAVVLSHPLTESGPSAALLLTAVAVVVAGRWPLEPARGEAFRPGPSMCAG